MQVRVARLAARSVRALKRGYTARCKALRLELLNIELFEKKHLTRLSETRGRIVAQSRVAFGHFVYIPADFVPHKLSCSRYCPGNIQNEKKS